MIRYEDECCDCATPAYPCRCSFCPNRRVPHFYCDECGDECEDIYEFDGEELCIECIEKRLTKVKGE